MKEKIQSKPRRLSARRTKRFDQRFKTLLGLFFFLVAGTGIVAILASADRTTPLFQTTFDEIRFVPVLEMPARAVEIVGRADATNHTDAIRETLRSVSLSARPGVMPYAVSALLRKFPGDFEFILQAAAGLNQSEPVMLASVAAQAGPDRAEQITFLLSSIKPEDCIPIALTVNSEVPGVKQEILRGMTNAVPRLAASVGAATRAFGVEDFEFVLQNALDRVVSP